MDPLTVRNKLVQYNVRKSDQVELTAF